MVALCKYRIADHSVAMFLRGKMIYDGRNVLAEPKGDVFVRPPFPVVQMQQRAN